MTDRTDHRPCGCPARYRICPHDTGAPATASFADRCVAAAQLLSDVAMVLRSTSAELRALGRLQLRVAADQHGEAAVALAREYPVSIADARAALDQAKGDVATARVLLTSPSAALLAGARG